MQHRRRRALQLSLVEGALQGGMLGVAESYLGAFAVELGRTGPEIAILATLPLLLGACAQLLGPRVCQSLGCRKQWVVGGATLQALSLGGFAWVASHGIHALWPLLLSQCLFWVGGGSIAPAWSAWMKDLTVTAERGRYFAQRSAVSQAAMLLSFVLAGILLEVGSGSRLEHYAAMFWLALALRLGSAALLSLQPDVPTPPESSLQPSTAGSPRRLGLGRFEVPVVVAALAFGTHVAAPFFTPYMLRDLRLSYATFAGLAAVSILAKAAMFPWCHRLAGRFGLRPVLAASGVGVAAIPLVWAYVGGLPSLIFVHALGGVAWAACEFASLQLLLSAARGDAGLLFLAQANSLTGIGQVAGAVTGGQVLTRLGLGYHGLFLLSAALRLAPVLLLLRPRRAAPRALPPA